MEVSKPKSLRLIESGSMIQQRLGFFVPLLILTSQTRYPNWNQLSFSLYSFVKEKQWKWLWDQEKNPNINFYGHRGIPSPETAVEYVKWAIDLKILEKGLAWSFSAQVLRHASQEAARQWIETNNRKESLNPLKLNAMQQTLLLRSLLEADGDLYIPFLSNISAQLEQEGSICLIEGAEVLLSTLEKIVTQLESSDNFEDINYGRSLKTRVFDWEAELKGRKSGKRKGQCSAEHRVTPRLEASVDLSLIEKDPRKDPYKYEAQESLARFLDNFTTADDQTIKHFFEKAAKTYDIEARRANETEIYRILLDSHRLLRDSNQISVRPSLRLFTSLRALHQSPHLILEIDQADAMLERICKDNPNEAYILVNEFGQPIFVHIDQSLTAEK